MVPVGGDSLVLLEFGIAHGSTQQANVSDAQRSERTSRHLFIHDLCGGGDDAASVHLLHGCIVICLRY